MNRVRLRWFSAGRPLLKWRNPTMQWQICHSRFAFALNYQTHSFNRCWRQPISIRTHSSQTSGKLRNKYQEVVKSSRIKPDGAQSHVIDKLSELVVQIESKFQEPTMNLREESRGEGREEYEPPQGAYIYGGVGTGKTMVMDLFFDSLSSIKRKKRVHYQGFMLDIHARSHAIKKRSLQKSDAIPIIADEIVNEAYVLCLDELQVTDIVDAMMLLRLLPELRRRGLILITTSNRHPDDLYKNGLQRKNFLPCINYIKEMCQVLSLDAGIEYRKQEKLRQKMVFLVPAEAEELEEAYADYCKGQKDQARSLELFGRKLLVPRSCGNVCRFTFKEMCGSPLSAADYRRLADAYEYVFVTDIPKMTMNMRNETQRFITAIDAFYETRVKVIISAEALPAKLFEEENDASLKAANEEVFAFGRCLSRLEEMQSRQYIESLKLAGTTQTARQHL